MDETLNAAHRHTQNDIGSRGTIAEDLADLIVEALVDLSH